ncbi:hypothetical protein V2J09_015526 [Rumex salicifolius]
MTELSPLQSTEEDLLRPNQTTGETFDRCGIGKHRTARRRRLIKKQRSHRKEESDAGRGGSGEAAHISSTTTSASDSSSSSFSPGSSSENLQALEEIAKEEAVATCVSHGMSSVLGRRREMEDTVRVELEFAKADARSRRFDFFGVFDGHGGAQVAEACRDRMHRIVEKEIAVSGEEKLTDWERIMGKSFEKMDCEVSGCAEKADGRGSTAVEDKTVGSTAVVAVIGREEVVVANCGDSRAVICRNGTAVPLTVDHKPDRADELARIEAAGGKVINWNGYRVLGVLATSRSIGDGYLKPFVIAKPEITVSRRSKNDEFLILASDGLWDVVSNEVACHVTRRCLEGRIRRVEGGGGDDDGANRASRAAALLVELAIARGSRDNITVVVVQLNRSLKAVKSSS